MLFYKAEGLVEDNQFSNENAPRREIRERIYRISKSSEEFNLKNRDKGFFYIADISDEVAVVGGICNEADKFQKILPKYLGKIGLKLKDIRAEEVTFDLTKGMLNKSCAEDFIEDDDEILARYGLDKLVRGIGRNSIDFGENLIEEAKKEDVYKDAEIFLAKDTFFPELDRIYAGKKMRAVQGHPVHYLIETDSRDTRNGMYRALLRALYANGRLQSKRYCFVDFRPGENISRIAYDSLYRSCIGGTVIVRYHSNDDTEDDCASADRDTVELLSETMKKYHNHVLTVFCMPRECGRTKQFFYENLSDISLIELHEEFAYGERAKEFLKRIARDNSIRTDKKLFAMIEEDKGYLASDLCGILDRWYDGKLRTGVYPQYREITAVKKEALKAKPKGSAYDDLKEMIGIAEAKKVILNAVNYFKAQKVFADKGMKKDRPAMHMVFTGNPGTAKTTVARLFASIMRENGLLSKGKMIEVGRGDLVGKYVGWTAQIIQQKFKEASGSVLFIDEAYSLVDDRSGSFGDEAINTIVQEMENHREDVVVIFAGYPDKMEEFLKKNPGLRSRIAFHVPFSDYETGELCDIARLIARKKGLKLTDDACEKIATVCDSAKQEKDFGNGRFVRNIIEKAKMSQAVRLLEKEYDLITEEDVATICAEDIEISENATAKAPKVIGFRVSE